MSPSNARWTPKTSESPARLGSLAMLRPSSRMLARGVAIDIVTDQSERARPTVVPPRRRPVADWLGDDERPRGSLFDRVRAMAKQVKAMVEFQDKGAVVFDYGNSIRREAELGGYEKAFQFPGFVPAYIRPPFAEGKGPFRSGRLVDPADIAATDKAILELFPDDEHLKRSDHSRPARSPASRDSPLASVGLDTKSAISPDFGSTRWSTAR